MRAIPVDRELKVIKTFVAAAALSIDHNPSKYFFC
jgi:hypothetical protein